MQGFSVCWVGGVVDGERDFGVGQKFDVIFEKNLEMNYVKKDY